MIRKIENIVLALVLVITTTGITYHYHYCGNTLMAFSVVQAPKPCCEHPEDCCRDKAVNFQLKNDFHCSPDLADLSVPAIDVPLFYIDPEVIQPVVAVSPKIPNESPPPRLSLRLALLQQFLI